MENNANQKYIYIRSLRERVPVTQEEFDNYYHEINLFRQKQQYHGRCVCPAAKRLDCDMDCVTCPFRRAGDQRSLDIKVEGGGTWLDEYPDFSATPHDLVEDLDLLHALSRVLQELTPNDRAICNAIMEKLPERVAASKLKIPRTTYSYQKKKLLARLKEILQEYA